MPVPKASKAFIQTTAGSYQQQLYSLKAQMKQQNVTLAAAAQAAELPYIQRQYRNVLNNIQEQIVLCERLRMI